MNIFKIFKKLLLVSLITTFFIMQLGCSKKKNSQTAQSKSPEEALCSSTTQTGLVVSGVASYEQMLPKISGGLSIPISKPIRRAEVMILNSAGAIIQCGETDTNGNYSLAINPQSGTFTVKVNSRANNTYIKASVLDDTTTKKYYSISGTFTATSSDTAVSGPTLTAKSTGTLEGGAFNILEQILLTNEYIISHSTDPSCNISICSQFEVLNKVNVYWKVGYTPGALVGNPNLNVSFFDSGASIDTTPSLYILGGSNGDVDYSDTDHYDNSVIIHEYAHFLEYFYGASDSPGGSHNGNLKIDPRLAWSEGLADFLPSAVTGVKYYLDTEGSPYGSTATSISINLEKDDNHDRIVNTTKEGEGVYREISISRALNDYIDSTSDEVLNPAVSSSATVYETSNLNFAYIWAALTNSTYGLKKSSMYFRSMGHFNESLFSILGQSFASNSSEIEQFNFVRKAEFQPADTSEYSQLRSSLGATSNCSRTINPKVYQSYQIKVCNHEICDDSNNLTTDDYDIETVYQPDIYESSDYISYYHSGGALTLSLVYSTETVNPSDLGLILYSQSHVLDDQSTWVGFSKNIRANESPANTEKINISNLPAGIYLIEVKATTTSTVANGLATYDLKIGDQYLCP